jgi:hypothetical protein
MLGRAMRSSNVLSAVTACLALAAALSGGAAGCGSGKSTGGGGGSGGGGGGNGVMSWKDDGVLHQTSYATASLVASSGIQILQIAGGEASGIGIALGVTAMPAVTVGAFQCGPAADGGAYPITSFSYTAPGVDPLFQSCTVAVETLGTAVSGTFSAVLTKTAGGTKAITEGSFNLPLNH